MATAAATAHDPLTKAPVFEAVFELRTKLSTSLSLLPGAMAAALRPDYPHATETDLARLGGMLTPPPETGLLITHQYRSEDGKRLVQLGPTGISVNALAYPGYQKFRDAIEGILKHYSAQAALESVVRLGLRYLNRLPRGSRLLAPLTVRMEWPAQPSGKLESVAARSVVSYEYPIGRLGIAISEPYEADGVLLDLDFFHEPRRRMSNEDILTWIDAAHEKTYEAFRTMVDAEMFARLK